MFNYPHTIIPVIFRNFFTFNRDVHSYPTRQSNHIHASVAKSSQKRKTLSTIGVNVYNYFCDRLSMDCLYVTYKYHLKNYLLENEVINI